MPVAQKAICGIWQALPAKQLEEVVEEGKEFVDSKKAVLREAFDAGREAMRRERDRLREEDRS